MKIVRNISIEIAAETERDARALMVMPEQALIGETAFPRREEYQREVNLRRISATLPLIAEGPRPVHWIFKIPILTENFWERH